MSHFEERFNEFVVALVGEKKASQLGEPHRNLLHIAFMSGAVTGSGDLIRAVMAHDNARFAALNGELKEFVEHGSGNDCESIVNTLKQKGGKKDAAKAGAEREN